MMSVIVNLLAVLSLVGVALGWHFDLLSAGNAFFGALSVLILFTGFQLLFRGGMPLPAALLSMAFDPGSYPAHIVGYASYVISTALSIGILVQTVSLL